VQVETEVGRPRVNYREAITQRVEFDYLHKKQSGAPPSRTPLVLDAGTPAVLTQPVRLRLFTRAQHDKACVLACGRAGHAAGALRRVRPPADPGRARARPAGGQGQYGRVIGYMEPLPEDAAEKVEFAKEIIGNAIPPTFIPACEKGFREAANSGTLIGHPVEARARGRRRAALKRRHSDGAAHLSRIHVCA